ncbi:MAG: phenylalanine--tRNA ligase subunit beta, partial [Gemmatimonadota bacterium]
PGAPRVNVSVAWLRALAPQLEGAPQELADRLSMRAVAVDAVEPVGEGLADLVVARVLEVEPHPKADRLAVCRVDAGDGDPIDVVCGAPNVEVGALYPYVPPGGVLPGGFRIESRKIRGRMSHGMLCSEREIGLGRDAAGILRLSGELAPGRPLADALGLPDARLVLDLTPNRVDLACHVGVARELTPGGAAGIRLPDFGGPRWEPEWVSGEREASAGGVTIGIEAPDRCARFLAAIVRGVKIGASPEWLAQRLRVVGSRPINNVVDATNYVLLELNHPIHAYDLALVAGPELRARAARRGEQLRTLDGQDHVLDDRFTVIADRDGPVGFAGVMGGEVTEVRPDTVDLLIECAVFDPRHTRRSAKAAGLSTDASYRFERGVDETDLELAIARCVELILAVAGGRADPEGIRVGRLVPECRELRLRPERVTRVLGLRLSGEEITGILEPLGFEVKAGGAASSPEASGAANSPEASGAASSPEAGGAAGSPGAAGSAAPSERAIASDALLVGVPGWRRDVEGEIDLIEEVARRYGYENFPEEPRSLRPSSVPSDPCWERGRRVRELFAGLGFLEARSAGFVPEEVAGRHGVRLLRPLSAEESWLRPDVVPVLLARLEHNFARGRRDVRLFEIGTAFARRKGGPSAGASGAAGPERRGAGSGTANDRRDGSGTAPARGAGSGTAPARGDDSGTTAVRAFAEELRVGAVFTGARAGAHWSGEVPDLDVWDLRGIAELVAGRLGLGRLEPGRLPDASDPVPIGGLAWLGAERFGIVRDGEVIGVAGRVRAERIDAPRWAGAVWALEFRLEGVALGDVPVYRPIPAYPAVSRDLALVLPLAVQAADVDVVIREAAPDLLESLRPFDEYRGPGIETGHRSLAWRLVFRAPDRTLRDEEVEAAVGEIIKALEARFDVRVRSS